MTTKDQLQKIVEELDEPSARELLEVAKQVQLRYRTRIYKGPFGPMYVGPTEQIAVVAAESVGFKVTDRPKDPPKDAE